MSSRVIATPREIPSRQEVIRRERIDERSRQRNKRMFGALLGTLQKFRQEETKLKAKVYIYICMEYTEKHFVVAHFLQHLSSAGR